MLRHLKDWQLICGLGDISKHRSKTIELNDTHFQSSQVWEQLRSPSGVTKVGGVWGPYLESRAQLEGKEHPYGL